MGISSGCFLGVFWVFLGIFQPIVLFFSLVLTLRRYGSNCDACLADANGHVCSNRGSCDGDGTSTGTGRCNCLDGATGNLCELCTSNRYGSSCVNLLLLLLLLLLLIPLNYPVYLFHVPRTRTHQADSFCFFFVSIQLVEYQRPPTTTTNDHHQRPPTTTHDHPLNNAASTGACFAQA